MSAINTISVDKLLRLIGTDRCPAVIDVRSDEEFSADNRFIPASIRRCAQSVGDWAGEFAGHHAIVVCETGAALSPGVAAWLRHAGVPTSYRASRTAGLAYRRPKRSRGRSRSRRRYAA